MNISIIGIGYVGCTMAACLSKNNVVYCVEADPKKLQRLIMGLPAFFEPGLVEHFSRNFKMGNILVSNDLENAIINSDVTFITVGTPSSDNGYLDLSQVYKVAEDIGKVLNDKDEFHTVAVCSTTIPGASDKIADIIESVSSKKRENDFSVVCNPEFLREGSAIEDFTNPEMVLIGTRNLKAIEALKTVYCDISDNFVITDVKVAEILKYVNNSYHAMKICFANEIGAICKTLGINGNEVMDIFCMDKKLNISSDYFIPGHAYGGSCLPKDLRALETLASDNNVSMPLINSINKSNDQQMKNTVKLIEKYTKEKVGILGLAFKSNTDDLRNSHIIPVINYLLEDGIVVEAYDEVLERENRIDTINEYICVGDCCGIRISESYEETLINNDVIVIANNNDGYKNICNIYPDKMFIDLCGQFDNPLFSNVVYLGK